MPYKDPANMRAAVARYRARQREQRALVGRPVVPHRTSTPETFWAHGERVGECLEWDGAVSNWGYGRCHYEGRRWTVSRLAWTLAYGPIPAGQNVLHRCDNPKCFEPAHLWLGTLSDNIRDMLAKGRGRGQFGSRP